MMMKGQLLCSARLSLRPIVSRHRQTLISNATRRLATSGPHKTYFQQETTKTSWWQRKYVKGILLSAAITGISATATVTLLTRSLPTTYPETDSEIDIQQRKLVEQLANLLPIVQEIRAATKNGKPVWKQQDRLGETEKPQTPAGLPTLPNEYKADVGSPAKRAYLHETLRGMGRVPLKLSWWNDEEKKGITVIYVGWALSGWPGVAHGGFLATILDEALGRTAIASFPARTGVTANLNVDYRKPCRVERFIVVKTETVEATGKKAKVRGTIQDLEGNVLVEASGLFVVPSRYILKPIL